MVHKASAEEMKKLMQREMKKKRKPSNLVIEEEPKKVILRIKRISRNGIVFIEFNQKLRVPSFIDKPNLEGNSSNQTDGEVSNEKDGRRLIPLSALDVSRDIFDFIFVLKSDVEPEEVKYFLEI